MAHDVPHATRHAGILQPGMAHALDQAGSLRRRAPAEVVLLLGALTLARVLPALLGQGSVRDWVPLTAPSLVLLTASVGWFHCRARVTRQRSRSWWSAVTGEVNAAPRSSWPAASLVILLLLSLLAAALLWPAARVRGLPPTPVELGAIVLLVPVAEEAFFRGALLLSLRDRLGAVGATLVVSAVFGLLHLDRGMLPIMLGASVALCFITMLTRGLLWAVLLHGTWNTLTMVVRMPPTAERLLVAAAVTILVLTLMASRIHQATREADDA